MALATGFSQRSNTSPELPESRVVAWSLRCAEAPAIAAVVQLLCRRAEALGDDSYRGSSTTTGVSTARWAAYA